jgi:beta-phosphoglucomutase
VNVPIRAIVFDFDGVLANSEPLHLRAYQEVLSELGITLSRDDYYASYLGFDDDGVFSAVAEANDWNMTPSRLADLVARKGRIFDAIAETTDVLYPGAGECIKVLAAEYALGIASGALRPEIVTVLKHARLDHHFRFIVASGDTLRSKPAPDPYVRAAQLHGLAPGECVAIEDSRWGLASARDAGLTCVGITNTYGRQELGLADRIIDSLSEFTPAFIRTLRS